MKRPAYVITVAAHGITSDMRSQADDLLDAVTIAKKWQDAGQRRISITLARSDLPDDFPWPR